MRKVILVIIGGVLICFSIIIAKSIVVFQNDRSVFSSPFFEDDRLNVAVISTFISAIGLMAVLTGLLYKSRR